MTAATKPRGHLVERAAAALAGTGGFRTSAAPVPEAMPAAVPVPHPPARPPINAVLLARAGLIETVSTRTRFVEEIAVVQHQLLRSIASAAPSGSGNPRLVLFTSALPGEGKTFCALNVAAGIAASGGRQAVVVDVDGKPGSLTDVLECGAEPGMRTLSSNLSLPPARLALPTARDRLFFVPYGKAADGMPIVPPGAAIAVAIGRLAAAMPDWILLLDAPPCLSTSEASVLAPSVGQVVMVVQAERAQREEVEAALDMVSACSSLQLLLNRMQQSTSDSFGAQDYGSYHGSYRAPAART